MTPIEILKTLVGEIENGRSAALCVVVATRGSTPQPAGVMVCVLENSRVVGTLGGGCVEADVRRVAHQSLGEPGGKRVTFKLDADFGYDDGMICGGEMDVVIVSMVSGDCVDSLRRAVEAAASGDEMFPVRLEHEGREIEYRIHIEAPPALFVAGAGHIGRVLCKIAVSIGFDVHVIDDRSEYANAQRFAPPIHTHVGNIAQTLKRQPIDRNSFVVIVTRGHKHDEAALEAVLDSPAKYIGMIGSRRKIDVVFADLLHGGTTQTAIDRVRAPIGLDIGAVSTEEIAVSVAAEMIQVRRAKQHTVVEGPFRVSEVP